LGFLEDRQDKTKAAFEEWCNDMTGWVALMTDRRVDLDHLLEESKTETYIHSE